MEGWNLGSLSTNASEPRMIEVLKTDFAEYFSDEVEVPIFVLFESEARLAFESVFGKNASHYFKLAEDRWPLTSDARRIGYWREAYEAGERDIGAQLLTSSLDWSPEDVVQYFVTSKTVFESTWAAFVSSWMGFLTCADDATIVKRKGKPDGVMFTSLGEIRFLRGGGPT